MENAITHSVMSIEMWVGIVISSVIALAIGYYFDRRTAKEPIACYSTRSVNVIDIEKGTDLEEKIAVSYDGEQVPRLSVGIIRFWNGGNSVLHGRALVQLDPLRIGINTDGEILEAKVIADPKPQCGCAIRLNREVSPNIVLLTFDFLDRHDGIAIRILHTTQDKAVRVLGTLKGVRLEDELGSPNRMSDLRIKAVTATLAGIAAVATVFFDPFRVFVFVFVCGVPGSFFLSYYLKKKGSHKVPEKLRAY